MAEGKELSNLTVNYCSIFLLYSLSSLVHFSPFLGINFFALDIDQMLIPNFFVVHCVASHRNSKRTRKTISTSGSRWSHSLLRSAASVSVQWL